MISASRLIERIYAEASMPAHINTKDRVDIIRSSLTSGNERNLRPILFQALAKSGLIATNRTELTQLGLDFLRGDDLYSDAFVDSLFDGVSFGGLIDDSVSEKKIFLEECLTNHSRGFFSGISAFSIMSQGGLIVFEENNELNAEVSLMGELFLECVKQQ